MLLKSSVEKAYSILILICGCCSSAQFVELLNVYVVHKDVRP